MNFGICNLSLIPLRAEANDSSEQKSQLLYGELLKVLEKRKFFSRVRTVFDGCEGWVNNLHYRTITQEDFYQLKENQSSYNYDLAHFVHNEHNSLMPVVLGADLSVVAFLKHQSDPSRLPDQHSVVASAMMYLNAPSVIGGKSPFGIDASGLTQMAYRLNGIQLKRTSLEQSTQGEALSFIEEAQAGDLAFFDNKEGIINHVGILLENNYIIHSYGCVRIDRIDHTGIFNLDTNTYSHPLRVIKTLL